MALTTLTVNLTSTLAMNGAVAAAGLANGTGSQNTIAKQQAYNHTLANGVAFGADEGYCLLSTIPASSTLNIDFKSFTDIAGQTTVALARFKGYRFHLLGTAETAPDGTAGTICTSISVAPAGSNGNNLNLTGTTPAFTVNNASVMSYGDGTAAGIAVGSSTHLVTITNNDSSHSAVVLVSFWGCTT